MKFEIRSGSPSVLVVPWAEVEAFLGRAHDFSADDDQRLLEELARQGVHHAPWKAGWFSEVGWCLER